MTFNEAYSKQIEFGYPIKRKTQTLYGLVINVKEKGTTQIKKFVDEKNQYPLDLEDILSNDWQVKGL